MPDQSERSGKIFCIGFQKTGTSSLRDALSQVGYSVTGVFGRDVPLDELRQTYVERGYNRGTV